MSPGIDHVDEADTNTGLDLKNNTKIGAGREDVDMNLDVGRENKR